MSGPSDSRDRSTRHIVVVYPAGLGHYVDREFLGLVPGARTTFVVPDDEFARHARAPIEFVRAEYRTWWPRRADFEMATTGIPNLAAILQSLRPDVVVTYELHSSLTSAVARWAGPASVPHVVLCYETGPPAESCWGVFPVTRWAAQRAGRTAALVVAHTDRARRSAIAVGVPAEKTVRLYPGVYLPEAPQRVPAVRPRFGYLGGLRANKGLGVLLSASRTIATAGGPPPFEIVIGGSGPMADEVRRTGAVAPFVRFVGWVPEDQKPAFLGGLDALVYPSSATRFLGLVRWEEQTATTVLEGFGAGVPAIATTSGALPEIVGSAGWVVPMDSPSALAQCLRQVADDRPSLRAKSEEARRRSESSFDIRRVGIEFGHLTQDLARAPAASP